MAEPPAVLIPPRDEEALAALLGRPLLSLELDGRFDLAGEVWLRSDELAVVLCPVDEANPLPGFTLDPDELIRIRVDRATADAPFPPPRLQAVVRDLGTVGAVFLVWTRHSELDEPSPGRYVLLDRGVLVETDSGRRVLVATDGFCFFLEVWLDEEVDVGLGHADELVPVAAAQSLSRPDFNWS